MSESIYTQFEKGKIITPVNGKDYETVLPAAIFPTAEQFGNKEMLLTWANENDFAYELIQKGLQKSIIEVRATFKATKKDETWKVETAQANVDKMKWEKVEKPNTGGTGKAISNARYTDCMTAIGEMTLLAIPKESIRKIVIKTYGEELVAECFAALEKAAN
jgi:hypothetical protein